MTKTAKKRKVAMPASIRHKLSAAVCMLLVSSIMLVSSTYAWFTLSTAPEVTGITTNVGANGNLEMALLNAESYLSAAEDLGIQSRIGDSSEVVGTVKANETWGNLVDLSDVSYGLSQIALTPARLNLKNTGTDTDPVYSVSSTMLLAPSYGSDGRVIEIKTATATGSYNKALGFDYNEEAAGVRAIGTTSSVTKRISAYRSALSTAAEDMTKAKNLAQESLRNNTQNIATLMVAQVQDTEGTNQYDLEYLDMMDSIISGVTAANTKAEEAIRYTILAYNLSAHNETTLSDEQVEDMVQVFTAEGVTLADLSTYDRTAEVTSAIALLDANTSALEEAQTELAALRESKGADGKLTWTEIYAVLGLLVNKNNMLVCGYQPIGAYKNEIVNAAIDSLTSGGVPITMKEGSGVYYNIAKMCGNYTVQSTVHIDYNSISANAPATMTTEAEDPIYLQVATSAAQMVTPPVVQTASSQLSETYGYALDFGFRTNAAGSNLQLQTAGVNRVYTDDTSADSAIQGSGSYMKFTTANSTVFTTNDVRALMSAIRVAFVVPENVENKDLTTYDLLGIGALDITVTTDEATGVTTYSGGTVSGNSVQADLYLYDFTVDADGIVTLGDKQSDKSILTALDQTVAKKVTVIVYLDGDCVDNTMVANANTSMSGILNLQFSSSATLTPMENSSLKSSTGTGSTTTLTVNRDSLKSGLDAIKKTATYTTAYTTDAAKRTTQQANLISAVSDAELVYEKTSASQTEINNAVSRVQAAYLAAGGTTSELESAASSGN